MRSRVGPALPRSIIEEIGEQSGSRKVHKPSSRLKVSRKEARKQDRFERKQRKVEFHGSVHSITKRTAEGEHENSPHRKKTRLSVGQGSKRAESSKEPTQPTFDLSKHSDLWLSSLQRSQQSDQPPSLPRTEHEEEEDRYIAYLEAKLGWSKGGKRARSYGKGLEEDGLDELLRDLDNMEPSTLRMQQKSDQGSLSGLSVAEDSGVEPSTYGVEGSSSEPDSEDEEWQGISQEFAPQRAESEEAPEHGDPHAPTADNGVGNDSRYVPPHLRNRGGPETAQESEMAVKLTRQLKGLLNRMSELNIGMILESVEDVYRNNRRHDVSSTITKLVIDGISSHSILLDSYVVLHAAFVSALHKLVGVEFVAFFVQNVVASYERALEQAALYRAESGNQDEDVQSKECSNLIVLLSELYNFQVTSCLLVHDIIRVLLEGNLSELKVELLLKITRNSGYQLRSDDPSALKDIIHVVHSKIPERTNALSSRARFMVETLSNLKKNKAKRNASSQAGGAETAERLKKFLSGLSKKRHVMAHEPLRVTLDDLHNAESKGKWWLVGAAWGGDPLVDRQKNAGSSTTGIASEDLLYKLAKKQGMNTEIRRNIFINLMSSRDYVDASEKLSHLKLTEVQQREIIRVVLHCCGNEKSYNPYYALIVQQLCRTSQNHKFTLQYCLWDFLRDLGEVNVGGAEVIKNLNGDAADRSNVKSVSITKLENTAKAFAWWIAKDCCSLAVLKPINFTTLKPQTRIFLVELLTQILISSQVSTPAISTDSNNIPNTRNRGPIEEVFIRATKMTALALGLIYFMGEVTKEYHQVEGGKGSQFLTWGNKVALDTLRTGMDVIPNL